MTAIMISREKINLIFGMVYFGADSDATFTDCFLILLRFAIKIYALLPH